MIQAIDCVVQLHAIGEGWYHGDVKPDNFLVDSELEKVYLTDFGAAFAATLDHPSKMHTPAYCCPERIQRSSLIDGRSDVFSLGVMLWETLTLREACRYRRDSRTQALPPIRESEPGREASEALIELCERCLSPDPTCRPPAVDLRNDLTDEVQRLLRERDRRIPTTLRLMQRQSRRVFVGRERELDKLRKAFAEYRPSKTGDDAPSVHIHGGPGVGKSYLLACAATDLRGNSLRRLVHLSFDAQLGEIDTAGASDGRDVKTCDDLQEELAGLLQVDAHVIQSDAMSIQAAIDGQRVGIVVENVDGDAELDAMLRLRREFPRVPFIATSRITRFGGEFDWSSIQLEPFGEDESLQQLDQELAAANHLGVSELDRRRLVQTLGGLPLAIHIAASHLVSDYSVDDFLDELDASDLDVSANDDVAPADRTLMRVIAFSLNQFVARIRKQVREPDRQNQIIDGLLRMSLGPTETWPLDFAIALSDMQRLDWLKLRDAAERFSLLRFIDHQAQSGTQIQMHPLVARVASTHLARNSKCKIDNARAAMVESVTDWFIRLFDGYREGVEASINSLEKSEHLIPWWLDRIPSERSTEVELTASKYVILRGRPNWKDWLQKLVKSSSRECLGSVLWTCAHLCERLGDVSQCLKLSKQKLSLEKEIGRERETALAWSKIADVLQIQGHLEEAMRIRCEDELPLHKRLGDDHMIAITKGRIADVLQCQGDDEEALRIRRDEQLPVYERLDDARAIAVTKGKIADVLQKQGHVEEGLHIRRDEQLPVFEQLGDVFMIAVTKGKIADVLLRRGHVEEALHIRRNEQLPVFEHLGHVLEIAHTKGRIAGVLHKRGDVDEALRIRRDEQLPIYERLGHVRAIAITKGQIADMLQQMGDIEEAFRIRLEQLPAFEQLGDDYEIAMTRGKIAEVLQQQGCIEEALRIHREEVLPVLKQLGYPREIAMTKGKVADILQLQGDISEALRIRLRDELPVYKLLRDAHSIAVTKGQIADLLQLQGDVKKAIRIRRQEELPTYVRLGYDREISLAKGKIGLALLDFPQFGSRDEAVGLLVESYRGLLQIKDANAVTLRELAAKHDIDLDGLIDE
ncbi:MAG: protein kinase [Planctomycetota bacterium]